MSISKKSLYAFVMVLSVVGSLWLWYNWNHSSMSSVCLVKNITGYPCPSCGSTRSVLSMFQGNMADAFRINPLGIVMMLIMILAPIWITVDVLTQKDSFHKAYMKFELYLKRPVIRNSFIILILINWGWNIIKHL